MCDAEITPLPRRNYCIEKEYFPWIDDIIYSGFLVFLFLCLFSPKTTTNSREIFHTRRLFRSLYNTLAAFKAMMNGILFSPFRKKSKLLFDFSFLLCFIWIRNVIEYVLVSFYSLVKLYYFGYSLGKHREKLDVWCLVETVDA